MKYIILLLLACSCISKKQCAKQSKLEIELFKANIKQPVEKVEYHYRDSVIYHAGSEVEHTIFLDKEVPVSIPIVQYIKDKEGLTQLKIEYDSLLKKYKIQCETLSRYDTVKLSELNRTITKHFETVKEPENSHLWIAYVILILGAAMLGYGLYKDKNRG